nr:PASTA domain-containing protein [Burkholderiales bacterium]
VGDVDDDGHADLVFYWSGNDFSAPARLTVLKAQNNDWRPARAMQNQFVYHVANVNDDGTIPLAVPLPDNFAVARTNVFGTQAQVLAPVDPRLHAQTSFTYKANDGALDSPPATVTIDIAPANRPPQFDSTPPTRYFRNGAFSYTAHATDPDVGDTVTYSLVYHLYNGGTCTIGAATGVLSCDVVQTAEALFLIAATDSQGERSLQTILMSGVNNSSVVPNVIGLDQATATTTLVTAGLNAGAITPVGNPAPAGQVLAQAPAAGASLLTGEAVALAVSTGPAPAVVPFVVGKQLSAATTQVEGLGFTVAVTPQFSNTIPVNQVMAQSPAAGTVLAPVPANPVTLTTSAGPPLAGTIAQIVVEPGPTARLVGENQQYKATAIFTDGTSADVTLAATWLSMSSGVASINAVGLAHAVANGQTFIEATVGAVAGQIALNVVARAAGDSVLPVAIITAPAAGGTITGPVTVTGTATDANFLRYELAVAAAGDAAWTLLAEGTAPVVNSALGVFDPTLLVNDLYTLRLAVFDRGGNRTLATTTVQVSGNMKVGLFTLGFQDLRIPAAGIPITIARTYDSRDKAKGDFGIGWRLGIQGLKIRANRVLGTGWVRSTAGIIVSLAPTDQHKVSLTLSDGRVEEFDLVVSPTSNIGSLDATAVTGYAPRPRTLGALQALDNPNLLVLNAGPEDELVDDITLNAYDPKLFRYTAADGTVVEIHVADGVRKITDPSGNTLTFGPAGIVHSAGKSVAFARDSQGRITQITDPLGNAQSYVYDGNGDLASHTGPIGDTTRFEYDRAHGLLRVTDPLNRVVARNDYDASGRLLSTTSATGRQVHFTHNLNSRQEVMTDIDGNVTAFEYDPRGNVVTMTDALGGVTTHVYDADDNQTSSTNPLGQTTTGTFDSRRNLLGTTNPLGQTTTFTFGPGDRQSTVTDPLGRTTSYAYNAQGKLVTQTNALGIVDHTSTFDAQGNQLTRTNAAGGVIQSAYDAAGNRTSRIDPRGNSEHFTHDANGNLLTLVNRLGATVTSAYDTRGLATQMQDPLGNTSILAYDALSSLKSVADALGATATRAVDAEGRDVASGDAAGRTRTREYDARGNLRALTDSSGRQTLFEYDALGRKTKTIFPDGVFELRAYDAAGRNTSRTDANGNITDFAYDAAGRLVQTTDALGGITQFAYDAAGNKVQQIDALGQTFLFAYNALNQRTATTHPDGAVAATGYDVMGHKTSETDPAGRTTTFAYDGNGNLAVVTDPALGETRFAYDAENRLLAQTDANGRVTSYTYDANGRRKSATLPGGQGETYDYDARGNAFRTTDRKGNALVDEFDLAQRRVARNYPGGSRIEFTFTPTDGIATATDSRGVTSYTYDLRDRIARIDNPDGSSLAYGYDAVGNRISVTAKTAAAAAPRTTTYTYDALNRLSTASGPGGLVTTHAYDAIGNLAQVAYPNGTATQYTYDSRSFLSVLRHRRGAVILDEFT